ncbi:hypothetical protein D3C78_1795110 [compost metagenome]
MNIADAEGRRVRLPLAEQALHLRQIQQLSIVEYPDTVGVFACPPTLDFNAVPACLTAHSVHNGILHQGLQGNLNYCLLK